MKRRNFLTTTLTVLLVASAMNLHASERKTNMRSLRFVQLTDLYEDGTFQSELVYYNWKQKKHG
jgi:hypothetical protein